MLYGADQIAVIGAVCTLAMPRDSVRLLSYREKFFLCVTVDPMQGVQRMPAICVYDTDSILIRLV